MKKYILRIFLFFVISIVSFSANYSIKNLDVRAVLRKDGSMLVNEAVTYKIGDINGVYFDIDAKGYGGVKSLKVFENDTNYPENKFKEVNASNFEVTENDGVYRVKLYSKNQNNTRIFKFSYELPEAIKVYNDVAQLNRKMVGQDWQKRIGHVTIEITIPVEKNYDNSKILVFGHGPLTGEVDKVGNTVIYKLNDYTPGNFLEAHILMEPEIFSEYDKSKIIHLNEKQELLNMEKRLAESANNERKRQQTKNKLFKKSNFLFVGVVSIWGFMMLYIFGVFRRKNKSKEIVGKYLRELPNDFSPAIVAGFMTKNIYKNAILATIVDLIRKKVLTLNNDNKRTVITLTGDIEKLSPQEKLLVEIYINDLGDGKSIDLKSFGFFHKVPLKVAKKFESWKSMIQNEINQKKLNYETFGSITLRFFILFSIIFVMSSSRLSLLISNEGNPYLILIALLLEVILVNVIGIVRIPKRELIDARKKWKAFKNFLSDYSQLEEAKITSVYLWEQYFVYAIALGVSKKVVNAYKKALDTGLIKNVDEANSFAYSPVFNREFHSSFDNLENFVTETNEKASRAVAASRSSSSSGRGGGFSSGSSGGGGSHGGGGAF